MSCCGRKNKSKIAKVHPCDTCSENNGWGCKYNPLTIFRIKYIKMNRKFKCPLNKF